MRRFGRNQKRKAREALALLEGKLQDSQRALRFSRDTATNLRMKLDDLAYLLGEHHVLFEARVRETTELPKHLDPYIQPAVRVDYTHASRAAHAYVTVRPDPNLVVQISLAKAASDGHWHLMASTGPTKWQYVVSGEAVRLCPTEQLENIFCRGLRDLAAHLAKKVKEQA